MYLYSDVFNMMTIIGLWRPLHSRTKLKIILYKIYSFIFITALHLRILLHFSTIFFENLSFSECTEIFYTLFTATIDCFTAINWIYRREHIIELAEMLNCKICIAKNEKEFEVQSMTDKYIRQVTILSNFAVSLTIISFLVMPLILHKGEHVLVERIYIPYDLESNRNYWLTYAFDVACYFGYAFIYINNYLVIAGFMLQACAQFDILSLRIDEVAEVLKRASIKSKTSPEILESFQRQKIEEILWHHCFIYKYARKIMNTFDWIIGIQLFVMILIIAMILYQSVTYLKLGSVDFIISFGYMFCMIGGFLIVCWFGNEVTLKSEEFGSNIYKTDWMIMSDQSKKKLIIIMQRTSKPIIMKCGYFFVLNNDTFTKVIKMSFSFFNVLRSSM